MRDNLQTADLVLDSAELQRLAQVSRPPLIYSYWYQAQNAADRLLLADLSLVAPYLRHP